MTQPLPPYLTKITFCTHHDLPFDQCSALWHPPTPSEVNASLRLLMAEHERRCLEVTQMDAGDDGSWVRCSKDRDHGGTLHTERHGRWWTVSTSDPLADEPFLAATPERIVRADGREEMTA